MGALVTANQKIGTVIHLLHGKRDELERMLPKHLTPDRLFRLTTSCMQDNPSLMKCTTISLCRAVMKSAQYGLELGGALGEAYLVPHKDVAVFYTGYRGLIKLALNSGKVARIEACEVYDGDAFKYAKGTSPFIDHVPTTSDLRGDITHFYAIAFFPNGSFQFEVMEANDVWDIRDRCSKAKSSGPWKSDTVMMGRKTAIRRLATYLPLRSDILDLVKREELVDLGIKHPSTLNKPDDNIIDVTFKAVDEPDAPKMKATTVEDATD